MRALPISLQLLHECSSLRSLQQMLFLKENPATQAESNYQTIPQTRPMWNESENI